MPFLADTNLLLRGAQVGHPMQEPARRAIRTLLARGEEVFLLEHQFPVLPDTDAVYHEWRRLVTAYE